MVVKDLKEQPESKYILLAGAGRPTYYAVADWDHAEGVSHFYDDQGETVYVCRTEGSWAVVNRNAIRVTTDKELTAFQMEDAKVTEEFYEKLDPQGWAESKKVAMASLGLSGMEGHSHGDKVNPTGQYL